MKLGITSLVASSGIEGGDGLEQCLTDELMKLKAQLSGKDHEVSLNVSDGAVDVAVDERRYDLQVRELASGEYLLINGSNVYKCRVSGPSGAVAAGQSFAVVLRGRTYGVALVDPKRLRSGQSTGGHHTGAAEIVSPMPGKIVRVLVQSGDQVEAGAGIIVVEAMKMQNEMKAPKAGTVVSINAEEGATVNAGDVLAVIE
jgi:biotin carboxyl carrier protein